MESLHIELGFCRGQHRYPAISRTATTGVLSLPGAPFAGVERATPGLPAFGLPAPLPGTEVVSVRRPPTPGQLGYPPPGISLQGVQRAVADLRRLTSEERPLTQLMVVAIGDDVVWHEGGDPAALVSAHRQPGQRILIVPVGEVTAELHNRLDTGSVDMETLASTGTASGYTSSTPPP